MSIASLVREKKNTTTPLSPPPTNPKITPPPGYLSLNGVEEVDAPVEVHPLEGRILQSRHRQRLEVKQLAVRRVLGRQDEVSEADRQNGLAVHPPVCHVYLGVRTSTHVVSDG